jgi:Pyruvate/2-oxoacid:ferredoxin oxidoreductase delta subunit
MASHKVVFHFPVEQLNRPVISELVRTYDLEFNILRAEVKPSEQGFVVLELTGEEENFRQAIEWVESLGVRTQPLSEDVVRIEEKCTHCSACVTHCPVAALVVDSVTKRVEFVHDACIGCGICVQICPPRAMQIQF